MTRARREHNKCESSMWRKTALTELKFSRGRKKQSYELWVEKVISEIVIEICSWETKQSRWIKGNCLCSSIQHQACPCKEKWKMCNRLKVEKGKSRFMANGVKTLALWKEVQLKNKNNTNHLYEKMQPLPYQKMRENLEPDGPATHLPAGFFFFLWSHL